ncbi:MAG: TerB family tellurite resistance protein [Betaproteobacteria bacterium]|nr:TerB family tellurite resistance protein [Betaproteobacteria bacterium]
MLSAIREFFDKHLGTAAAQEDEGQRIRIATAALLTEMARMDGEVEEAERAAALSAVREKFALTQDEAATLIALAEEEVRQAPDYFQFTSLINKQFTPEQKVRVIEHMWAIAYADAELTRYEEHLVRKIADLLYVPNATVVAAKIKARDGAPR